MVSEMDVILVEKMVYKKDGMKDDGTRQAGNTVRPCTAEF
jgi:hypothetical protein